MRIYFYCSPSRIIQNEFSKLTVQNLEDEYVKQLQRQIYCLETECQYLYPFLFLYFIYQKIIISFS